MSNVLAGYPTIIGDHKLGGIGHTGPASYTQMTTGPLAGGDTVTAREFGLQTLDGVFPVGLSDSGVYRVEGVAPVGNPSIDNVAARATAWRLRWVVVATGAEAAGALDLSAQTVRLFAVARV